MERVLSTGKQGLFPSTDSFISPKKPKFLSACLRGSIFLSRPAGKAVFAIAKAEPMAWRWWPPGSSLPQITVAVQRCPSVTGRSGPGSNLGCRRVSGTGIHGVWEGQQRGLWAPAAEAGCKKIQGSQLVQPSSKPASYSFYIISVQGGQTQSDLGTAEVCEERRRRSYCCPIHFSLTVLHGTDILGPFSPPRLHPALVPTGSSAAQPENRSEEQWLTLHGSWLFPRQLLPLPALVPRRQLSLSPSEEENSNVVE